MKRIGYLYEKLCDIDYIKKAIYKASKGKKSRYYVKRVLNNIDYYANDLKQKLENETLQLSLNKRTTIYDHSCCKQRNITIPHFYPDQVIHWLIMMTIQPILEKGMYQYCCGSIPKRGGMYAKNYIEKAMHDKNMRYVAKLDISKFFNNINIDILHKMLYNKIKDKKMLNLLYKVLLSGEQGLPIGFYTSQWLSNFYLQNFDHYVKEVLKIKYYVRYVDDMVLIDNNKQKLHKAIEKIEEYLSTIDLSLKYNWQVWKINSRPIDFVGFKFYTNKTLLRKKIFLKLCKRMRKIKKTHHINIQQARSLLSLLGWLSHINSYGWYNNNIKPYVSISMLSNMISKYSINGGKK